MSDPANWSLRQRVGLVVGPIAFLAMMGLPPPAGMSEAASHAAAVGLLMAVWWMTEAIPIPATALLPLALFPILGVVGIDSAAAPYANPIIFLFLGGFLLALAMQRWGLHRRIALLVIRGVGVSSRRLVGGFMLATALLSMWVSNTATAVMMLPIGLSVVGLTRRESAEERNGEGDPNFAVALMLGIAFAASIGGLGTLIGTPPNALLAGFLRESYGIRIGFARWMLIGVPLMMVLLPLTWILLTRIAFPIRQAELPGGRELIARELRSLGPISRGEWLVATVFTLTALCWILRPLLGRWVPGLSDTGIAMAAALALFLIPVHPTRGEFVLDWTWAARIPWDVLLLFGGGLSLADAISETGLAEWIGGAMSPVGQLPLAGVMLALSVVILLLSELASNTATAAAFLPVVASLGVGIGASPLLLTVVAALAASGGFMMPVATPPNAIAYGSGYVTVPQMVRAGAILDLIYIMAVTVLGYLLVPVVFGIGG